MRVHSMAQFPWHNAAKYLVEVAWGVRGLGAWTALLLLAGHAGYPALLGHQLGQARLAFGGRPSRVGHRGQPCQLLSCQVLPVCAGTLQSVSVGQ